MLPVYDIIIVGAGINGCALAYTLKTFSDYSPSILVLEQEGIAAGGSGAAGAFINPKIAKAGELMEVINEAYAYSMDFYTRYFEDDCSFAPLLHLAKFADENEKVAYFKANTTLKTEDIPQGLCDRLIQEAAEYESVYLPHNAIVEAKAVCEKMLEGVSYVISRVNSVAQVDGQWHVEGYRAKRVVLCTGAYPQIVHDPSIQLRAVHGQRCEVSCSNPLDVTIHQHLSISAKKKNGNVALGATHYLDEAQMPDEHEAFEAMLALAEQTYPLEDVDCLEVLKGMRSGSNDYLPVVGQLIDIQASMDTDKSALQGNKSAKIVYYEGLYMINGVGGYGFVLAPYLATMLSKHLFEGMPLPSHLTPDRFYYRYAKKTGMKR